MEKKVPINGTIYLPDYFVGSTAKSFQEESDQEILYWDFEKEINGIVKLQIELLLNYIVKTIKNNVERRNRYLIPLKCLFCYTESANIEDILKMEIVHEQGYALFLIRRAGKKCTNPSKFIAFCRKTLFVKRKEIDWDANVWYVEKLNINPERYSRSNSIESFSFLDIRISENRGMLQKYVKYLLTVTSLNLGTICIQHTYVRGFLRYLDEKDKKITDIDVCSVKEYFDKLGMQNIRPQSFNNKIQGVLSFLRYLQVTDNIADFTIPFFFYQKKSYPVVNDIVDLDKKLDLLMECLPEFPEQLRIMSLILLYTGIDKGKMLLLKNEDFYYDNGDSWMKVPDTNRSVPIPDILHWLILKYAEKNHIPVEEQLFRNRNRRYTARSFAEAIVKQCTKSGILDREYIFKGNGYQKELGKALYRYGASIQTIREYMGYSTDEAVRKSIGLDEEEVAEKSDEFFRKESNSLGGGLLMAKYDKMNKVNRQESQKKAELAIAEIRRVAAEGKMVSVSELSKSTGLSKGFFYKNEQVRLVLDEEKENQDEGKLAQIKREVRDMSLEKQVELYKKELERLLVENENLKKENKKLTKALDKQWRG